VALKKTGITQFFFTIIQRRGVEENRKNPATTKLLSL